jgi:hypothetical protein
MPVLFDRSKRTLGWLLLAVVVVFAQQAAQLHALSHARDEIAQPHKGKAASHPIEQCIAFHAIDSALVATAALHDFDFLQSVQATWVPTQAHARAHYRLPSRAPPRSA